MVCIRLWCGVFCCGWGGGCFSQIGGGIVIGFDVTQCCKQSVRAVSLVVAIRRLAKPLGIDSEELSLMELQFRDAAAELQRVEKLMVEGATFS